MTPVGQLIWRNRHRLEGSQRLLLIAPPDGELPVRLARSGLAPEAISLSHGVHRRLEAVRVPSRFSLVAPRTDPYDTIVLFQPREKALLEMLLELGGSLLSPSGALWLAGENRAGIKSCGKRLALLFEHVRKLDAARHCTLFLARGPRPGESFSIDEHVTEWQFETCDEIIRVCDLPGVFARGRLDPGTRLLLQALGAVQPKPGGRILDFACGSGVIGLTLAKLAASCELTLVDDALPAIESTRRSLKANGVEARVVASEGLSGLLRAPGCLFDWIVSNPPFHSGVRLELDVTRRFLADCRRLMAPGGRLCLVANAHLPYGDWLPELFATVQVLAADRAYNVWLASGTGA